MAWLLAEDRALKALLQGVTVGDPGNPSRAVDVWYRWPQKEIRSADWPFITIEMTGMYRDTLREQRGEIDPSAGYDIPGFVANGDPTTVARAEMPIPVTLQYQVSTYATNPLHDRQLLAALTSVNYLPFRNGNLDVSDNGTGVTQRYMEMQGVTKADYRDSDGTQVFRNAFFVKVSSELLSSTAREVKQALSAVIDVTPNDSENTSARDGSGLPLETINLTYS